MRCTLLAVRFALRSSPMSTTTRLPVSKFKPTRGSGDSGESSLYNLERRWKDDAAFEALGAVDELSSMLGVCREMAARDGLADCHDDLVKVQCNLQDVGSHLATPEQSTQSNSRIQRTRFDEDGAQVDDINGLVDVYAEHAPALKTFVLPGGGVLGAQLHMARSMARRAERTVTPLVREGHASRQALVYLNRLSDLLFVMARSACHRQGHEEMSYVRPVKGRTHLPTVATVKKTPA